MHFQRIILAAAAVVFALSAPAEARHHRTAQHAAGQVDVAAIPAYPVERASRTAGAGHRAAQDWSAGGRRGGKASARRTAALEPSRPFSAGLGLVTVQTAAGIPITCSPGFAYEAESLIADAVGRGIRFSRITCYSTARSHKHHHGVCTSNHCTGEAFDSHPSIPAWLVRQHGLRSGCDFRDCAHVDNARNVGGIAYWNSVKHYRRVRYAGDRQAALELTTLSARSRGGHHDGCSRRGDAAGINCQLRRWVHCSGSAVRATSFNANGRRACPGVRGYIVAHKHKACGTPIRVTNASTGAAIDAVVGDRGPGTIAEIDLSHQVAAKIGIRGSGCVLVDVGIESAAR